MAKNKKRRGFGFWLLVWMIVTFIFFTAGILLEEKSEGLSNVLMTIAGILVAIPILYCIVMIAKAFLKSAPKGTGSTPIQGSYKSNVSFKERDTGMISCKKCGFMGPGSGICPRCKWNRVQKITSQTRMISCQKCGYLGAGAGACPRCGWTITKKIN